MPILRSLGNAGSVRSVSRPTRPISYIRLLATGFGKSNLGLDPSVNGIRPGSATGLLLVEAGVKLNA